MKIHINSISALGKFGHYDWERLIAQRLIIDLTLEVQVPVNDALTSSLDYMVISQCVIEFVERNSYNLIETYAVKISNMLLDQFNILSVDITVAKPGAVSVVDRVSVSYFNCKE
ncbi:dihydroneopterin aldolase [Vibrio campbellii]|uniref:dihydroneopterin aldolase n=1 Tax=Vibrio campbellii TaxID=680 RepID=UPI0018B03B32|nr:dihydroneopterin aldolase [Vibrio campbellii]